MGNDRRIGMGSGFFSQSNTKRVQRDYQFFIPDQFNQKMYNNHAFGWCKDLPDIRDFSLETPAIQATLALGGSSRKAKKKQLVQPTIDLREFCSPVHDQLSIGSCTAQAAASLLEYMEIKAFGKNLDFSRLFLYKATRNLLGWKGDTGAYIRTTIGAIALFGAPPEKFYPYQIGDYDEEPGAFLYSLGKNFSAVEYFRLDTAEKTREQLLESIKDSLAKGFPLMFGFTVYGSISQAEDTGNIPFPAMTDRSQGGHAVLAVGYDDSKIIQHNKPGAAATKGAILIQNSWGTNWGEGGFGWLPYEYILRGLAVDWWSIISKNYVQTGNFGF